ncbi:condensation domain-containing protein [Streptomyces sp. NPDC093510]|uniref:condensation domain-containing protein n=1 Tax=Streptomyces sp. NPDC093510 TaxID=3155199 RepID=UPI00343E752E
MFALDHVLLLSMHRMVSDGWSRRLLARGLSRAYAARRRGVTPDTPRLPVSYADHVLWGPPRWTACPRSCGCRWTGRVGRCRVRRGLRHDHVQRGRRGYTQH